VVLVDDMYGSGGSIQEAGRALRAAGAAEIVGLAATKTLKYARGISL
jgi:predicted amidophosphoribosyltransferase